MIFLLLLLISYSTIRGENFNKEWYGMQQIYRTLVNQAPSDYPSFMIPEWSNYQTRIAALLQGPPLPHFLTYAPIMPSMVRVGFGNTQQFEMNYLTQIISPKNQALYDTFTERFVGGLGPDCPTKSFSVNILGQLFYLANVLEQIDYQNMHTFMELGGGYGALAYLVTSLLPQTTYIIIDLPEMIALQYLYLHMVLPQKTVMVHTVPGQAITPGTINLVPIFFNKNITVSTDVFASHFALSECPPAVQQLIIDKKFFNAKVCFVVGEADGWGPTNSWYMPKHHTVMNAIKQLFSKSFATIYHNFNGSICSYQIIGVNDYQ